MVYEALVHLIFHHLTFLFCSQDVNNVRFHLLDGARAVLNIDVLAKQITHSLIKQM